jgi:arylformamidase
MTVTRPITVRHGGTSTGSNWSTRVRVIDISPPLTERSAVFPGDEPLRVRWTMHRSRGDSCNVSCVSMSPHTGAHIDAPSHVLDAAEPGGRIAAGELPLDLCIGPCRVFWRPGPAPITLADVRALPLDGVERALFRTRDAIDATAFPEEFAYFTSQAATALAELGVRLVGIDTPSVDQGESKELEAHRAFFTQGVCVLEGLDLSAAPAGDYELIALPLRFMELDGSPVRAVLRSRAPADGAADG